MTTITFEDYYQAIRQGSVRFVLTGRATHPWWLHYIDALPSSIQFGSDGGPSIAHGRAADSNWVLVGRHYPTDTEILINGHCLAHNEYVLMPPGSQFVFTGNGPRTWFSVSLPMAGANWHDRVLGAQESRHTCIFPISGDSMRNLNKCLESAFRVAQGGEKGQDAPSLLLEAVSGIIAEDGRCARPSSALKAFETVASTLQGLPSEGDDVYVDDLARSANVHPRTLLRAFHRVFRMGPVRYLRYRQLSQIRLRLCDPNGLHTVTEIMQSVGASDMGRLSGAYRNLFGETPSDTLRAHRRPKVPA